MGGKNEKWVIIKKYVSCNKKLLKIVVTDCFDLRVKLDDIFSICFESALRYCPFEFFVHFFMFWSGPLDRADRGKKGFFFLFPGAKIRVSQKW